MSNPLANKKLGQHYLINTGVTQKIVDAVDSMQRGSETQVIEIGPGPGALTVELLARGFKVLAIELDQRMIEHLTKRFENEIERGQLSLIAGDALEINFNFLKATHYIVCGNLPYNVGTHIVFRFLEEVPTADAFCFMLQKEVVQRFISEGNDADYGIPSVKLAWTCEVLGHFWVKPGSFSPPPKVDSGVFWFRRLSTEKLVADPCTRGGNYDKASAVVQRAFQHRRKMLRASFSTLKNQPEGAKRPQELRPYELFKLAESLIEAEKLSKPE